MYIFAFMDAVKILIVDDEKPSRNVLRQLIDSYCPHIFISGEAGSAAEARVFLEKNKVDALFVDISMPTENGFELLQSLPVGKYFFVFVTAYDQYILKALRASAVDYLQKPLDIDELKEACRKLVYLSNSGNKTLTLSNRNSLESLLVNTRNSQGVQRLCLPSMQGFSILDVNDIVYLDADSNYTIFHLVNLKKIVISKSIKEYESLLDHRSFFRIHKSSIINFRHLKEFSRVDGYYAVMADNTSLPVSRRRLQEFMEAVAIYNS